VVVEQGFERSQALGLLVERRLPLGEQLLALRAVEFQRRVRGEDLREFPVPFVERPDRLGTGHQHPVVADGDDQLAPDRRLGVVLSLFLLEVVVQRGLAAAEGVPDEPLVAAELRKAADDVVCARGRGDRGEPVPLLVEEPDAADREVEQLRRGVDRDRADLVPGLGLKEVSGDVVERRDDALVVVAVGDVADDAGDAVGVRARDRDHPDLADPRRLVRHLEGDFEALLRLVAPAEFVEHLVHRVGALAVDGRDARERGDVLSDESLPRDAERRLDGAVDVGDLVAVVEGDDAVVDGLDDGGVLVGLALLTLALGDVAQVHGQAVLRGVGADLEPRLQRVVERLEGDGLLLVHRAVELGRERGVSRLGEHVPDDLPEQAPTGRVEHLLRPVVEVYEPPGSVEREERVRDAVDDIEPVRDFDVRHRCLTRSRRAGAPVAEWSVIGFLSIGRAGTYVSWPTSGPGVDQSPSRRSRSTRSRSRSSAAVSARDTGSAVPSSSLSNALNTAVAPSQ